MRQIPHRSLTVLAILALLLVMLGCQGLSSAKSDQDPPPPAAQLTASATSLSFGTVAVGTIQALPETVTNTGTASLSLTTVSVTGTGFTISGLTLPMVLAAGQSTSFNVVYQPSSVVTGETGNVSLTNTGTNSVLGIPLSGSGATPPALTASPNGYSFGTVAMGTTVTEIETLTNSGTSNVTISQSTVIGAGFGVSNFDLPATLAPNQSMTFGVTFSPAALPGTDGPVVLTVNGVNNAVVLSYSGAGGSTAVPAVVTPSPASLAFTNITTGQTSSQIITLTNTGGVSTTISQATASGTGFSVSGFSAGTLLPGATTQFSVTFAPTSAGTFPGTVTVTSNASNPSLSIPLSGTAVTATGGTLTAVPTTVAVPGNVAVGTSGTATGQLTAATANVIVSGVNVVGSEFVISGLSFPVTISAGSSATYTVTFSPTSSGSASTTASFASNASNAPTGVSLTGTAVAAPVYTVGLSWTASGSTGVTGYYIYRALYNTSTSTCGSYTKLNPSSPSATTTYTDGNSITDGDTYCYQVTAVNSSGEESTDSNMATAIIPAP